MEHKFTRRPAGYWTHDYITCHDYRPKRLVTIGQLVLGTLFAVALVALYVGFAWLEG